jgi:thioredoxin-like negative regulator of GroEL
MVHSYSMIARAIVIALGGLAGLLGPGAAVAADLRIPVIETTDADFQRDVVDASAEHLVVVIFEAPWCLPCRGVIGGLRNAAQTKGFGVVTLNIDANIAVPQRLKVSSIPVVVAYRGRVAVGSHIGVWGDTRDTLESFLGQIGGLGPQY